MNDIDTIVNRHRQSCSMGDKFECVVRLLSDNKNLGFLPKDKLQMIVTSIGKNPQFNLSKVDRRHLRLCVDLRNKLSHHNLYDASKILGITIIEYSKYIDINTSTVKPLNMLPQSSLHWMIEFYLNEGYINSDKFLNKGISIIDKLF